MYDTAGAPLGTLYALFPILPHKGGFMQDTHHTDSGHHSESPMLRGTFPTDWHGRPGVLLLHGFTSALDAVSGLLPTLDALGLPYEMPVLRGHNATPDALIGVRRIDWYRDAVAAFHKLSERADHIVVIGLSMGGLVALNLCARANAGTLEIVDCSRRGKYAAPKPIPATLCGAVLWAPALGFCNPLAGLSKPLSLFVKNWPGQDSFHDPECRKNNHNYKTFPTKAFCELYDYAHETEKVLSDVRVPLCIIHSKRDQVVPYAKSRHLFDAVKSPYCELHSLEKSGHELGQDMEHDTVFQITGDFLRKFME